MNKRRIIGLAAALWAAAASATVPWTPEEIAAPLPPPGTPDYAINYAAAPYDPEKVFDDACAFVASWQVSDPNDPNYGGIIEGEDLTGIIQSDNTQESIWDWSRWRELTGNDDYDVNVDRSWIYLSNFPAWQEEGWGEGSEYYRIYNCGWGLRAEMMYRRATGSASHRDYGDNCATFVKDNAISLASPNNLYCTAWAVGNLYDYAVDVGRDDFKDAALSLAAQVKQYAEDYPDVYIGSYSWAMSGGATIWGLHNSYFREHPDEENAWMDKYAAYMPEMEGPSGSWDNAWNGWFMLGHYSVYHATGDGVYWTNFDRIAANLTSQDTDEDGGIPPSQSLDNTHDHTWVTSYMCFMGMDRIIRDLSITNLTAEAVPGAVEVTWEPAFEYPAASYNVYRRAGSSSETLLVTDDPITGDPPYSFADEGIIPDTDYTYYVEAANLSGMTRRSESASVTAGVPPYAFALAQNYPNPCDGHTTVVFAVKETGPAALRVYDLAGREVYNRAGVYGIGKHALTLDLSVPPGVYIYKLEAGEDEAACKMVVTK